MKNFLFRLLASITNVNYYRLVLFEKLSNTISFYSLFLVGTTLVLSVKFWVADLPFLMTSVTQAGEELILNYPNDLVVEVSDGQLSSSSKPIRVSYPQNTPSRFLEISENLAIIGESDDIKELGSTLFLLTSTELQSISQGDVVSTMSWKELFPENDVLVTSATIADQSEVVKQVILDILSVSAYLFPVGMFGFLVISRLFMILLESAIVYVLIKIQNIRFNFVQVFQLVVSLFVPAEIINQISLIVYPDLPVSMLSLSFWILFIFVFFSLRLPSWQKI